MSRKTQHPRRGAALLMCLFMVFMISSLVLNIVGTETLQFAATRNTIEYDQALYWANAGVHHAATELMLDPAWLSVLNEGTLPPATPAAGYSVTSALDGAGDVVITSTGYSGAGRRTVQATIEL